MSTTDRTPVVVYDDGTPTGAIAMQRALDVASRIVLAVADRSPNHTANVTAADRAGVPVEVVSASVPPVTETSVADMVPVPVPSV